LPKAAGPSCHLSALRKVKALAHPRYHVPPAAVARVALNALDPRIPIAASRVWAISPQYDVKVFDALILGDLFLDSRIELAYAD
jgi:hypothetical protein